MASNTSHKSPRDPKSQTPNRGESKKRQNSRGTAQKEGTQPFFTNPTKDTADDGLEPKKLVHIYTTSGDTMDMDQDEEGVDEDEELRSQDNRTAHS